MCVCVCVCVCVCGCVRARAYVNLSGSQIKQLTDTNRETEGQANGLADRQLADRQLACRQLADRQRADRQAHRLNESPALLIDSD